MLKLAICVNHLLFFFFSSRRRHTRCSRDWSSDVCSSDLAFHWQEGDVLMWEDIGTIHNAVADYGPGEQRLVKRCQVMATMFYPEAREEIGRASCRERV